MKRELVVVVALTLGASGLSLAQGFDEHAAQQACRDDAFRYCQNTVPDRERTLACLVGHKDGLSPACRTVLARFLQPAPRRRQPISR